MFISLWLKNVCGVYLCVCMHMSACVYATAHVLWSEAPYESQFSPFTM